MPLNLNLANTLVGYHAHCTDGMVAAWAAHKAGVPAENLIPVSYGEPLPARFGAHPGAIVFLDFRPKLDELRILAAWPGRRVFVVDHHKAAAEEAMKLLPGNDRCGMLFTPHTVPKLTESACDGEGADIGMLRLVYIFDNERSGAHLAWDFFHDASSYLPYIVSLAEDYDLWRKKLPLTEEFHIMTSTQELSLKLIYALDAAVDGALSIAAGGSLLFEGKWRELANDIRAGKATPSLEGVWPAATERLRMRDDLVRVALSKTVETDLEGVVPGARFPMVNSSVFRNEIAQALLARGHEVAVVWAVVEGGKYSYSLRSKDVDVAAIARHFGGNGHARAAGFTLDRPLAARKSDKDPENLCHPDSTVGLRHT